MKKNTFLKELSRALQEAIFDLTNMTKFMAVGLVTTAFFAVSGSYVAAYPMAIIDGIARELIGTHLPFEQAYQAFSIAVLVLTMAPISIGITIYKASDDIPVELDEVLQSDEERAAA